MVQLGVRGYLVEIRRSVGASSSGNGRLCRRTYRGV
jgi:hypothetical protein